MINQQELLTQAQRDVLPEEAQQLYIDTYMRAWQAYDEKHDGPMSRETVASIAAMGAVTRHYDRDEVTFRWYPKDEQPLFNAEDENPRPHSALGILLETSRGTLRRIQPHASQPSSAH